MVFYLPFDFGYKALRLMPVRLGCSALKEVYRAKMVHDGVRYETTLSENILKTICWSKILRNSCTSVRLMTWPHYSLFGSENTTNRCRFGHSDVAWTIDTAHQAFLCLKVVMIKTKIDSEVTCYLSVTRRSSSQTPTSSWSLSAHSRATVRPSWGSWRDWSEESGHQKPSNSSSLHCK